MNKKNKSIRLRYHDEGNVHMDFHGATNTTIEFIIKNYGIDVMNDIFSKVGKDVYKDIHNNIKNGDSSEDKKNKDDINNIQTFGGDDDLDIPAFLRNKNS